MKRDQEQGGGPKLGRRAFIASGVAGTALAVAGATVPGLAGADVRPPPPASRPDDFPLAEATVDQLQAAMQAGKLTAKALAEQYLARIDAVDQRGPAVNAVLELNPDALAIAEALDAERKAKGPRGPLHGIPVLLKDNLATVDKLQTTAGSLALLGVAPPRDAFVVERLRAAGAVILGKTNLSEWANFRSTHASSGWSGRGGQTRNPYALDRTPSGSSSGSAVAAAANLCAVAVGTETDGSIVSPSSCCSLVGLKPTVGLLSRAGIVPISHSQDTPGPMCRTVRDTALLLGVMTGVDPRDEATAASRGRALADYTKALDPGGLKGARIGVARTKFFGYSVAVDRLVEAALDVLRRQGATVIDPADLATAGQFDDAEQEVLLFEFKADLNRYLADLGPASRVHSLAEVIAFNEAHRDAEMPYFAQELLVQAQAKGPLTHPEYQKARAKCLRLSRTLGIDATMDRYRLDALVAPTGAPPWLIDLIDGDASTGSSSTPCAVAGYPSLTVPVGYAYGLPVGMSFMGRAFSEATLLKLAYAYEQAAPMRQPPRFRTTAELPATGRPKAW
jgi:amidase